MTRDISNEAISMLLDWVYNLASSTSTIFFLARVFIQMQFAL